MRHVFLINPHAGKQDQTARIRALADRLAAAHNLDCRCLLTDRPGGAEVLSRALAETGEPVRIYACGGDGTVHEAANGIAGFPNAAMTVIPAGTGNDFLKNFGPDAAKFIRPGTSVGRAGIPRGSSVDCNGRLCHPPSPAAALTPALPSTVHRLRKCAGPSSGRGRLPGRVPWRVNFCSSKPIPAARWRGWEAWSGGGSWRDGLALFGCPMGANWPGTLRLAASIGRCPGGPGELGDREVGPVGSDGQVPWIR